MKIRIRREEFAAATRLASRQIPARPLTPALAGLLLDANGHGLEISAFDYETAARAVAAADVLEPGRVLVPGRLLSDIAGSLNGDDVDLSADGDEATLACGASRFVFSLMPLRDYPVLPECPPATGTVPAELLAAAVRGAVAAVDPDAAGTLAAMAGVRVLAESGELLVTATDRYRVAEYRLPWSGGDADAVTFPAKPLLDAVRAATAADIRLSLPPSGVAGLDGGNCTMTFRLIDCAFPPVERIFPPEFAMTAEFDSAELAAAAKRISLVAEEKTPLLMEFADGHLTVRASTSTAARGMDRIEAPLDGAERLRIAFKAEYLLDGLAPLSGRACLDLVDSIRPGLLRGVDDDSYRYLIMPVRHNWVAQL